MTTSNERILFIIKQFCNDNQAEFARRMGEKPQTISGWLKRNNSPRVLNKILDKFPDISRSWLLLGEGEMIKCVQEEKTKEIQAVPLNTNEEISVPLVSQFAYAGYLNGYQNNTYMDNLPVIRYSPDSDTTSENFIAFEVRGDSMDDNSKDSLSDGDIVICREIPSYIWKDSKLPINKWDFVIVHEDGIIVKRIIEHDVEKHSITIHSLNDFYPDKTIDLVGVKQIFCIVQSRSNRRRK